MSNFEDDINAWLQEARETEIHKAGNAQGLIEWYNSGADGQINWGSPGDFEACVSIAGKHLDNPEGFCQLRHIDATGEPAGKASGEVSKADEPNYGKLISGRKGEPEDKELYSRIKTEAKKKFDVYPSAVANGWVVQEYKRRGGKYSTKKSVVEKGDVAGHAFHGNQWTLNGMAGLSNSLRTHVRDVAQMLYIRASKNEPEISREIRETAQQFGGTQIKPEYSLKTPSSLETKLLREAPEYLDSKVGQIDDAAANVGDAVRFTLQYPDEKFAESVQSSLNDFKSEGFDAVNVKNYFNSDPTNTYRGINCVMRDTTSNQLFEVQFHTPESASTVNLTHDMYDSIKLADPSSPEYQAVNSQMAEIWGKVPIPTGIENIGSTTVKKSGWTFYQLTSIDGKERPLAYFRYDEKTPQYWSKKDGWQSSGILLEMLHEGDPRLDKLENDPTVKKSMGESFIANLLSRRVRRIIKGDVAGHAFHGNQWQLVGDAMTAAKDALRTSIGIRQSSNRRNGDKSLSAKAAIVKNALDSVDHAEQALALATKDGDPSKIDDAKFVLSNAKIAANSKSITDDLNKGYKTYTDTGKSLIGKNGIVSGNLKVLTDDLTETQQALTKSQQAINDARSASNPEALRVATMNAYNQTQQIKSISAFVSSAQRFAGDKTEALTMQKLSESSAANLEDSTKANLVESGSKALEQANALVKQSETASDDSSKQALLDQAKELYSTSKSSFGSVRTVTGKWPGDDVNALMTEASKGFDSARMGSAFIDVKNGYSSIQDSVNKALETSDPKVLADEIATASGQLRDLQYSAKVVYNTAQWDSEESKMSRNLMSNNGQLPQQIEAIKNMSDSITQLAQADALSTSFKANPTTDLIDREVLARGVYDSYKTAVGNAIEIGSNKYSFVAQSPLYDPNTFKNANIGQANSSADLGVARSLLYQQEGNNAMTNVSSSISLEDKYNAASTALNSYQTALSPDAMGRLQNIATATDYTNSLYSSTAELRASLKSSVDTAQQAVYQNGAAYYAQQVSDYVSGKSGGGNQYAAERNSNISFDYYGKLAETAAAAGDTAMQTIYQQQQQVVLAQKDLIRAESLNQHHLL